MTPDDGTVATLGPEGTYSHRAALKVADEVRFYDGVPEVAEAVEAEEVGSGVVPIENSIEGSVNATLDVLSEYDLYVTAEITVEVRHALLARSDAFDVVASHPQALAQCRTFLRDNYPDAEMRSVSSTAEGVRIARDDPTVAALAHPSLAGEGVEVVAEDVHDEEGNTTRFVRVGTQPVVEDERAPDSKTSIIVYPGKDRPGLLYDILGIFKERGVNLTRIESRPSKRELGDYVFHLDFVGGDVDGILDELDEHVEWVDYLGTYGRVE
ncbi:MAG: prephenate dehydratase [Halobacteria archaeon]|nr:prephenate dehydratase [Halobacteria archaeon]